jgi:hypothetical protein
MITRRSLLRSMAFAAASLGGWPWSSSAKSATGNDRPREFRWRVNKVHLETVKSALRFEGEITQEEDAKGIPLVFIFVGAVLLPYLAKAILALRRDIVHGGIVIDTRGEKIDISTDKSLPGGVIVMITPQDTRLYERDEIGNPAELVSALTKGL